MAAKTRVFCQTGQAPHGELFVSGLTIVISAENGVEAFPQSHGHKKLAFIPTGLQIIRANRSLLYLICLLMSVCYALPVPLSNRSE